MSRIETIESQVKALSREELAQFRTWFARFMGELWDLQFEGDVETGKLDALAGNALKEYVPGQSTKLVDGGDE
jgi:hypothetical protein